MQICKAGSAHAVLVAVMSCLVVVSLAMPAVEVSQPIPIPESQDSPAVLVRRLTTDMEATVVASEAAMAVASEAILMEAMAEASEVAMEEATADSVEAMEDMDMEDSVEATGMDTITIITVK
uniref:Uncharacterized protein n=1 Tax=Anopheles epiroticus TaxID=199890 RepID=A0A182P119_9DIPT